MVAMVVLAHPANTSAARPPAPASGCWAISLVRQIVINVSTHASVAPRQNHPQSSVRLEALYLCARFCAEQPGVALLHSKRAWARRHDAAVGARQLPLAEMVGAGQDHANDRCQPHAARARIP